MAAPRDRRPARDPWQLGFCAVVLGAGWLALGVWFPHDIKGGFIEPTLSGKPAPGDAFFPVLLTVFILVLGFVQLVYSCLRPGAAPAIGRLRRENLRFLCGFAALVALGLSLMMWTGPLVVAALQALGLAEHGYRQLSDTAPYKYLGYVTGGLVMTVGLIARAEGRVRMRALVTTLLVLGVLVLVLDVALRNIQLPPNADL